MPFNVKNKIRLGTLFLFVLLSLTSGLSIYNVTTIKSKANNVLKDNYESVLFANTLKKQLDTFDLSKKISFNSFDKTLQLQEHNITEPGENELTQIARIRFDKFKKGDTSLFNIAELKYYINAIIDINLTAIERKSRSADNDSEKALNLLLFLSGLVFLISFTFLINFPSIITNPIHRLTDAIIEITKKNYKHRINITNKDEFGQLANSFNQMAERLEFFENSNLNQLMFEKSRAEAVINSLKDASIGIDKNNIILFANFLALQLLGLRSDEIIGKKVSEVKSKNDLFKYLIENESTTPFKIVMENQENYFVKEVFEVTQPEGTNKVIVLRNITSFKELDQAKTNFIATISHELKTPLASSDFGLKLLENKKIGELTPDQHELVDKLKIDNQRMLKILSELLNMAQIETGKIQLNLSVVDPRKIIENGIIGIATNAISKNIHVENLTVSDLPDIEADADKTLWVLNNLLSNAIKYSKENSVVSINAIKEENLIKFSVKDQGPGIAPEYINKIFDKYFQIPGTNKKGTGLGLSICKEFINGQNGKLWVESIINEGATFYFTLPVA